MLKLAYKMEDVKKTKNNKQGGFLEIIIVVLIALFIMKYFGVTVSDVINWFTRTFNDVLK